MLKISLFELDISPGYWHSLEILRIETDRFDRSLFSLYRHYYGVWDIDLMFFRIS